MAKSERQKLKLLCLAQIFWRKTDVSSALPIKRLIDELAAVNIAASRKSLYDDIRLLREFGLDIRMNGDYGYYLATHFFEKPELKILMDALYSARFLSQKKSHELIHRLGLLTSDDQRKQLSRLLFSKNRNRSCGVDCYQNIQKLCDAIWQNRQISFLCFRLTPERKIFFYNRGNPFVVSPWELFWHNNHYYLICYRAEAERMEYFRIDRLMEIQPLKQSREGSGLFAQLDFERLTPEEVAGPCPSELTGITLRCTNNLSSAVMERFGQDVIMVPDWNGTFTAAVKAAAGPRFYAWVFSYGGEMEIVSPKHIVAEMRQMLRKAASAYGIVPQTLDPETGD